MYISFKFSLIVGIQIKIMIVIAELQHASCRDCTTSSVSIMDKYYMHSGIKGLSCGLETNIQCKQKASMHFWQDGVTGEGEKQCRTVEEQSVSRTKDSKVSGKVVYSTLPVSVCLQEQHSPTAQRRRGTRG